MNISIKDTLEAIALMAAMIAVVVVPHPAEAGMKPKTEKLVSITCSLNSLDQYFHVSDVSHGLLLSRPPKVATSNFSRTDGIKREVR